MVQVRTLFYLFIDIWDTVYSMLQRPARLIITPSWVRQRKAREQPLKTRLTTLDTIGTNRRYSRPGIALEVLFQKWICKIVEVEDRIHGLPIVTNSWLWKRCRITKRSKGY